MQPAKQVGRHNQHFAGIDPGDLLPDRSCSPSAQNIDNRIKRRRVLAQALARIECEERNDVVLFIVMLIQFSLHAHDERPQL